jgi:MFS family permease
MTDVATPITGPRQRSFRGWWVLSGLFLVYAASNGILVHSLPLLYPELIATFGWSEAQVTLPATILLVVSAITSPPVGYLLDKYSARLLLGLGAVGATAGLSHWHCPSAVWLPTCLS